MAWRHGTGYSYRKKGCRCDECLAWREAERVRYLARRHARGQVPRTEEFQHGTSKGYRSRKCRCVECRAWNAARRREYQRVDSLLSALGLGDL